MIDLVEYFKHSPTIIPSLRLKKPLSELLPCRGGAEGMKIEVVRDILRNLESKKDNQWDLIFVKFPCRGMGDDKIPF